MGTPIRYDKETLWKRAVEYLCTGLVAILCIIWGLILTVFYLLILLAVACARLFAPEETD